MSNVNQNRRYDLDWLRVLTILSVFFYHVGMIFVSWKFHINNNETSYVFETIMAYLHTWRLPLLFFISGAGTILAASKRRPMAFFKERNKRLFIPLVFGILVIVPPQVYIEKLAQFGSYFEFYPSIFKLVPYPEGSFSWHHLWFIVYLFAYSILSIPLITFLRSERSVCFLDKIEMFLNHKYGFSLCVFLLILTQVILRPYFPEETHDFTDLGYMAFYYFFFFMGMIVSSRTSFWEPLKKYRYFHFKFTLILMCVFYALWFLNWQNLSPFISTESLYTVWDITEICIAWSTVISVLGFAQVILNKPNKYLKTMNEGIYPFYILHQTIIIIVGYQVIQWNAGIGLKFTAISVFSFLIIIAFYRYFIYPYNPIRFLFGMKPLNPVREKIKNRAVRETAL